MSMFKRFDAWAERHLHLPHHKMTPRSVLQWVKRASALVGRASNFIAPPDFAAHESPMGSVRGAILFGAWTAVALFGVLGVWASVAPLESAAIAQGQVVVDSNKKTIQHLEGGIVLDIYVTDGKLVHAGEPLVKLDPTASKAKLDTLKSQYVSARAAEARLVAERDDKDDMTLPDDILAIKDVANAKDTIESQHRFFKSQKESLEGQISVLGQRIEQSKREMQGFDAQIKSADAQIKLLDEEISVVAKLLKEGNAMKPRLLALEREKEELLGKRGEAQALLSRAEQTIGETNLSITNQRNDFLRDVMKELKDTQVQIADLQERIRASSDVVNRIVITSPITGVVADLKAHTIGGVITPGEKIMDIIPSNDKLIVEAMVQPTDIDVVHAGLPARVRLTAYKTRKVPIIEGRVITVSADRISDPKTNASYFLARVEVDTDILKNYKDVKLLNGMPADVLIVTGERTLMGYLFTPITDALNHAFREQ